MKAISLDEAEQRLRSLFCRLECELLARHRGDPVLQSMGPMILEGRDRTARALLDQALTRFSASKITGATLDRFIQDLAQARIAVALVDEAEAELDRREQATQPGAGHGC